MIHGINLFFALFNNLAIFIALVTIYGYLLVQFKPSDWYRRQIVVGLSFGVFAIGCMYAKIPVFEGVIVDQRNAIIALSGAFGGPLSAILSAALAGAFRVYLGGEGVIGGVVGVNLAAIAGIGLKRFAGRFNSVRRGAISALLAAIFILPGFLFIKGENIQTGWELTKAMALPYGSAIFLGIFLGGLLLHREEERYQVELLFQESEEKYRELVEGTNDLITHADRHGTLTFVNHVAEKMLGLPPEECIGMSAFHFVHPDDRDKTIEWFNNCVAQKTKQAEIENRIVNTKTGKSYTVLWSSAFHFDNAGNLIGVGNIARDITEMRETEENYKNLFEKMPNGYAIHEIIRGDDGKPVDYRFISINPAMERMTELKAEEFVNKTVQESLPETKEYWFDIYTGIVSSGEPETFENYSEELDKYFEVTVYKPAEDQFACIFQDITRRKQLETQLRQSQKMEAVGRLAGGIAHDFNNILVPINLYTEMAMRKLAPDSKLYANMRVIREAAGRAADLTRQILAFGRKQVLKMQVLDLNTVVTDFEKMMRHLLREDIELQTILDPALDQISADKVQLEQVLMNLAVNARDAMPTGGTLIIETTNVHLDQAYVEKYAGVQSAGPYVMLAVSDTGHGMDAKTQRQIFEPFFTTKEPGKGTGLGLSTVFGIVKQHGGNIRVYSEPGKGTTFKIYLPRVDEAAAPITESPTPDPTSVYGTETILVIEDEEVVRQLVCETLATYGYTVLEAQNPSHALRLAAEHQDTLRLLVTDVVMPEMNGRELYQRVAAIQPDIDVLYMSGYTENVIAHQGILDEGVNLIHKPFTVQSLTRKVREVLG